MIKNLQDRFVVLIRMSRTYSQKISVIGLTLQAYNRPRRRDCCDPIVQIFYNISRTAVKTKARVVKVNHDLLQIVLQVLKSGQNFTGIHAKRQYDILVLFVAQCTLVSCIYSSTLYGWPGGGGGGTQYIPGWGGGARPIIP